MQDRWIVQYGLDQGYTPGTGDFSVLVRLIGDRQDKKMYVDRVMRRQVKVGDFVEDLYTEWKRMPGLLAATRKRGYLASGRGFLAAS